MSFPAPGAEKWRPISRGSEHIQSVQALDAVNYRALDRVISERLTSLV